MGSEMNGGGTDRPAAEGEEEKKGGAPPLEAPEVRFTKLFINGCFVDAVSGTCPMTNTPSRFLGSRRACAVLSRESGFFSSSLRNGDRSDE
jgi:hypothetical protein